MKSDSISASSAPSSRNMATRNRTRPLETVYAFRPVHLPPGKEANKTFRRPPGANARRRGSFWASPSPSSRIACSSEAMTSSISIRSWTSLSRKISATAGRIAVRDVTPPKRLASSRPRRPGACGAEAGVDSCARSVTNHGALPRVLVVSLAPAADGAKYASALGVVTSMSQARPLNVGLIGLGTVGSQIAERMLTWGPQLSRRAGVELCLQKVLVRDVTKRRTIDISPDLLTADPDAILDDPKVEVVMEVAGGDEPMRSYIERAIQAGKHVITPNKVVMAKHGPQLLGPAAEKNVDVYFEAAVGGGIPLISTFRTDLQANRIESVSAVINGTTNYVLGRMASQGMTMADALREAQDAGYAEADPTDDIGGYDATYKLAILASIAYEIKVRPNEIYREGIEGVEPVDFRYARELGFAIKLIAHTQRHPGRIEARVHPAMVSLDHPLARVEGAENAVFVEGDLVGKVLLMGQGAGGRPTASAVVGDLIDLARSIRRGVQSRPSFSFDDRIGVVPIGEVKTRAYYRIRVDDRPGVLAAIGQVFAEEGVSISSFIQKAAWSHDMTAELVVTTHPSLDASLQKARERMERLEPVHAVSSFLRVF